MTAGVIGYELCTWKVASGVHCPLSAMSGSRYCRDHGLANALVGERLSVAQGDPINHPAHYKQGGLEVIDAIEAWGLGFRLGNAMKYIARAGKKDPAKLTEDLKKARWYLDREIAKLEEKGAAGGA